MPLDPAVAGQLFTMYDTARYADFDRLARTLASTVINPFEFEADAERWMAGASDRHRSAIVAAAVALELASSSTRGPGEPTRAQQFTALQLRYVLAELGCAWLRDHPPLPAEESWLEAYVGLSKGAGGQGGQGGVDLWSNTPTFAKLGRMPSRVVQNDADRRRESDAEWRSDHQSIVTRLRREAARVSRSSRIEPAQFRFEHSQHVQARFSAHTFPAFQEAVQREGALQFHPDTLLTPDAPFAPVWLAAAEVEQIAKGGARQIRAVPPNRRMDRQSAERLIQIVPEPEVALSYGLRGTPWSAAFASLVLWDIAEGFQAVPPRAPFGAESALHLGQTYVRLARPDLALPAFARAEWLATTPYEQYLARLLAGAVFVRLGRQAEAIGAFQGALQAVPRAQSASFALAPLLLEIDAREQAVEILAAAARLPLADDPLDYYWTGDPARASRALARLREELRR
jgi:tetratricopeptide (TPR) repeat protein